MSDKNIDKARKEIDLLELFAKVGQSIKGLVLGAYDALWWLFVFGIKNYLYIVIFGLLGLVYGIYHMSSFVPSFESQMTIRTNALRSYEMKPYFDEITTYLEERDATTDELMYNLLGFDSLTNSKIVNIKAHYFVDVHNNGTMDNIDLRGLNSLEDTINVRDFLHLCIIANVSDPSIFPEIKGGIHKYLYDKDFLIRQKAYRLNKLLKEKRELNHELNYLDSLQREVYFNTPKAPSVKLDARSGLFLGNVTTQLFHGSKKYITKDLEKVEQDLELFTEIYTILSDFRISKRKTTSNIMLMVKPSILLGAFGYILSLLIYFFKKNYSKYAARIE